MRCPYIMRLLAATAAACALFLAAPSPSLATCDCSTTVTRNNIPICIGGSNYMISVEFCEVNYNPPNVVKDMCSNSLFQDRVSKIRKICFQGPKPLAYTPEQVIEALYCTIRSTGCTIPNAWGFTVPVGTPGRYCWEILAPKCAQIDINGCVIPCGDECNWCYMDFVWQNTAGNCALYVPDTRHCDPFQDDCEQGCLVPNDCYEPACCQ